MAKIHWSGGSEDLRIGCERTHGSRFGSIQHRSWPAPVFVERATASPDHYCAHCVKAARLALAAESAPKPSDVVWPKPRPISEAPTDEAFLGFVSSDKKQTVLAGWYRMTAASDVVTDAVTGWIILGAIPYRDQHFQITRLAVTHFLPLPPEVR